MPCTVYRPGLTGYSQAYRLQKDIRRRVINGEETDALILLEHLPVITVGKSGDIGNVLVSEAELAARGISLFFTDRGGDVTYHGPGQLVAYPIIDLKKRDTDAHKYVSDLEEVILLTLKGFSIEGSRDESHAGIWVDDSEIAAIGISLSKWVTMHGIALNVSVDLHPFSLINPCGFTDRQATSMEKILSRDISLEEVTERFLCHFTDVFNTQLEEDEEKYSPEAEMSSRLPPWFQQKPGDFEAISEVRTLLDGLALHTVCESALCPNIGKCLSRKTATFLILGNTCTRHCTFCSVNKGVPSPIDNDEPAHLLEAVQKLGLDYVVVTSVTRDDLLDGGAPHFASVIKTLRENTDADVEVLVPDFLGSVEALKKVMDAGPQVINHNVETVPRLYNEVRPEADYERSLGLLGRAKVCNPSIVTKSGLMLGLGETKAEVIEVMQDLLATKCDLLTIGQYLQPTSHHHPVIRYVPPDEFEEYAAAGEDMGFAGVVSAPLVRSSFEAAQMYKKAQAG